MARPGTASDEPPAGTRGRGGLAPLGAGRLHAWATLAILPCALIVGAFAGRAASSTNVPPTRHIIVVENSSHMKAQREQAADLISRLMLDGFRRRIRVGEVVELWVIENEVRTNALPAFRWHPVAAVDDSNSAYRLLRSLKSSAESVDLKSILPWLDLPNPNVPQLIVYLVTSGVDPIAGTPFDDQINPIFRDHQRGLAEAGHPFFTVLVAQDGEWIAHGVTPGDRYPYIPTFPVEEEKKDAPNQTSSTNATAVPSPEPAAPAAPTKPLTVDEIAVKMKEAAMERARTSPPPATVSVVTQALAAPDPITPPPTSAPTLETTAAPPPPSTNVLQAPASAPILEAPPVHQETAPAAAETRPETVSEPASPPVDSPPETAEQPGPVEIQPAQAEPTPSRSEPTNRVIIPPAAEDPPPPISPWKDLLVGTSLLLAAGALTVLLLRQVIRRPQGSLISESFGPLRDSSRKPPGPDV